MTWTDLQAEIADLFEGQAKRDRWDSSNGALDYVARSLATGISRKELAELRDLELHAKLAEAIASVPRKARPEPLPTIARLPRLFVCTCCNDFFGSRQSLIVHQAMRRSRRAA